MKNIALTTIGLFAAALSTSASAQSISMVPVYSIGTPVAVSCSNPGSSQDVAKTPVLKNTTTATIPKGKILSWQSSDGDKGTVKLEADLAPNGTVRAMGKAGQAYTCSASFLSNPDLTVTKAAWSGSTAIALSITNKDPWLGAAASVMRVEVRACSGAILQTIDSQPIAIGKGETKTFTVPAQLPSGKHYLRVVADNGKVVAESNESNNVWDAINSCVY